MSEVKEQEQGKSLNFIEQIVEEDLRNGKNDSRIQTRFPPEPNGYLHIGHAKAICLDFGIAQRYGGTCNLRFDDTNPASEDVEYVDAIMEDIKWLGFEWENVYYASDYFPQLYQFAIELIKKGLAYVDEQTSEQIAEQKGTPTTPGIASPYRNRPAEESLALFEKMQRGEVPEGAMTLRAKIDMASPNMHMRDPIIYRIIHHPHHRTGNQWNVYPMYDFAHGQSDYFEGVTHSLCTLEFVVHRPLYDYLVELLKTDSYRPHQYEFNRLNLTYTVMSKRRLLHLVKTGLVHGWDDPRMPTLVGMRRRGYTPQSIRNFIDMIGYTKFDATNDMAQLEFSVREDLNERALRAAAVLDPIKLLITNYPEGQVEQMTVVDNPEDPHSNTHQIALTRELYIERDDFMEDAPKKYYRLTPGAEVRLRGAYIIRCTGCQKDADGNVTTVLAEYLPETRSGLPDANRKVKGTIHWVSTSHALPIEVRLYDRLFTVENPLENPEVEFTQYLNPNSEVILPVAYAEEWLSNATTGEHYQFVRKGYFTPDPDSTPQHLVFNQTVGLRDSWSKIKNK